MSQKRLPYHIQGIQSNDELYGGARGYMEELEEMISGCIAEILKQMTQVAEASSTTPSAIAMAKVLQARAALDLANALIATMDVCKQDIVEFTYKLIDLANRQKVSANTSLTRQDLKYLESIVQAFVRRLEDDAIEEDFALVAVNKLKGFLGK
jgi:hypothetical protein